MRYARLAALPLLIGPALPVQAQDLFLDDRSTPQRLVESLYNAIGREEFARAFSYFANPPASDVEAYAAGFGSTEHVEVLTGTPGEEPAAGSVYFELPVVIRSQATDGDETIYAGCYTLRMPNPLNDPEDFTPLAIEAGTLAETDQPFGAEALPTRCGDDGSDLPPTDAALIEAERMFAATYGALCEGRRIEGLGRELETESHEIAFRYMHETSDDPMRTARLFRFFCSRGAYNETHVYFLSQGDGSVAALHFAVPELDIRYEDDDLEGAVESMTQIGVITRTELVNSAYDPDTQAILSDEKWRGVGDASSAGRWIFRYGTFSLVHYEVDASYDGEINPEVVVSFGETP